MNNYYLAISIKVRAAVSHLQRDIVLREILAIHLSAMVWQTQSDSFWFRSVNIHPLELENNKNLRHNIHNTKEGSPSGKRSNVY